MRKIDISVLKDNVVDLIGKQWMLITAGSIDHYNMMTASWGTIGFLWGKPVACVVIRPQRYTLEFVEKEECFTLSFFNERYRSALKLCGTKSGKEIDKATAAGITPFEPSRGCVAFKEARLIFNVGSYIAINYEKILLLINLFWKLGILPETCIKYLLEK